MAVLVGLAVLLSRDRSAARLTAVLRTTRSPAATGSTVSSRAPSAAEVALLLDLVAAGLASGLAMLSALEAAAEACGGPAGAAVSRVTALGRLGADEDVAWAGAPAELGTLRRCVHLVTTAGVAGVPVLRWAADDVRRRDRHAAQARAEALGVRMVLPLGLCALPAFTAWAVVPVVMSLAGGALG